MSIAEALNILAHPEVYAAHNLINPRFRDLGDGTVSVTFEGFVPYFHSSSDLEFYIQGHQAAQREANAAAQAPQE